MVSVNGAERRNCRNPHLYLGFPQRRQGPMNLVVIHSFPRHMCRELAGSAMRQL